MLFNIKYCVGKLLFAGCFTIAGLLFNHAAHAQKDTLNSLQEFRMRKGLPNFFKKLKEGKAVTVAYLGGSITAAQNGWRDQSYAWFQQQYPQAKVTQVNAGVGGTGSDLGAFRTGRDVLSHQPDLVFVEFAVNDGGAAAERIYQAMEGIVRQIWHANERTDICFVYTLSGPMVPTLQKGELWPSQLAMEQIAQYYQIPSIQFGVKVISLIAENKLIFQGKPAEYPNQIVFSEDNVHPLAQTGHKLYYEALVRSMEQIKNNTDGFKHKLGKPYSDANWEDATMIAVKDLQKTGGWRQITQQDTAVSGFLKSIPGLYKSNQPGAAIKVKFKGRMAGIYDLIGPTVGQFSVSIDSAAPKLYCRFDKYCTYYHFNYFCLPMMEQGVHEITFTVAAEKPDKMTILKKGNGVIGDLAKYDENACYPGWLLLIGKLKN
jgi:lysophospholipase L1-like esterase